MPCFGLVPGQQSRWGPSFAWLGRARAPVPPQPILARPSTTCLGFRLLVLVEGVQEAVDVLPGKVVGRGEAQLVRLAAADADLLFFPHPVFEVHPDDRRYVHGRNRAAKERVRRSPGLGAAFDHGLQNVVAELALSALDA